MHIFGFRKSFRIAAGITAFIAGNCCCQLMAQQKTTAPPEFVSWLPISAAEQQMKAATVEKDPGAEVLFWRVHVVDELLGDNRELQRVYYHYIRLKIFDEKGKEKAATIDLPYNNGRNILDVSGRTTKADGTVIDLDRKSVYKRDLVRAGGRALKAVSFALPGVEPGAIVDYRWRETVDDNSFMYVRLQFSREFPIERVTYFVKPIPDKYIGSYQLYISPFNCKPSPLKLENDGYNSTFLENVPSAREEPYAPSDPNVRPWALLHYQQGDRKDSEKYWNGVGKKQYQELKEAAKVNGEIKSAAADAVASAKNDDEKIVALIALVRKQVKNVFEDGVSAADREKYIKDLPKDRLRNASEIYKSGLGTANEMNVVFAAMAQQVGLEARPAVVADRNEILFSPKAMVDTYFLRNVDMAIKAGDSWKVYDVSTRLLPPGMISWREEGMYALISDPKNPVFIQTQQTPAESSSETRVGKLNLTTAGVLEGEVEEAYFGHRAEDFRRQLIEKSPAQREEWLRDRVTRMFPQAEVENIKIENAEDPSKALTARYHMEAPGFAQVTGKRILFHSSAFRRSQGTPFAASERHFAVEFPYGWKESDELHVQLPQGWTLDNADAPPGLNLGKAGSYNMVITISKTGELVTKREMIFGREGILSFTADNYGVVKKVFEEIRSRDQHMLAIKENK